MENFDERYTEECNGGDWRKRFYFDQKNKVKNLFYNSELFF